MKTTILTLIVVSQIFFITSCIFHPNKNIAGSTSTQIELQGKSEEVYPVHQEDIKPDTEIDYEKPAPPLTPEERQRLIEGTEKEDEKKK